MNFRDHGPTAQAMTAIGLGPNGASRADASSHHEAVDWHADNLDGCRCDASPHAVKKNGDLIIIQR